MNHRHSLFLACLCAGLGACASTAGAKSRLKPTYTGTLPAMSTAEDLSAPDKGPAPSDTTMPLGVGFTTGPSSLLVGATVDFPIDSMITFGPSVQYGSDDDLGLLTVTGQLKYFLPMTEDPQKFLFYATAGIGVASVDKEGQSGDSGALINIGAGLRLLTGEDYRIGSEARLNILPDELNNEDLYFSFELVQVIVAF